MTQEKNDYDERIDLKAATPAEARETLRALIGQFYTKTRYIGATEMNTVLRGFSTLLDFFRYEREDDLIQRVTAIEAKLTELMEVRNAGI